MLLTFLRKENKTSCYCEYSVFTENIDIFVMRLLAIFRLVRLRSR